jgi:tetratricopeptide (TPR) repeat protein
MAEPTTEDLMRKLIAMGRLTQDPALMLKAIEEDVNERPLDPMVHVLKGWALSQSGDPGKAEVEFDRAIALNPRSAWAQFRKGEMLRDAGRFRESLQCLAAAARLKPGRPDFWVERGMVEDELGLIDDSYASYGKAIACGDRTGRGWAGKARILTHLNRLEEALDAVRNAMRLDPGEDGFRRMEAAILEKLSGY